MVSRATTSSALAFRLHLSTHWRPHGVRIEYGYDYSGNVGNHVVPDSNPGWAHNRHDPTHWTISQPQMLNSYLSLLSLVMTWFKILLLYLWDLGPHTILCLVVTPTKNLHWFWDHSVLGNSIQVPKCKANALPSLTPRYITFKFLLLFLVTFICALRRFGGLYGVPGIKSGSTFC